jgi:hypothetical protein
MHLARDFLGDRHLNTHMQFIAILPDEGDRTAVCG